jgi:hypothetical protein
VFLRSKRGHRACDRSEGGTSFPGSSEHSDPCRNAPAGFRPALQAERAVPGAASRWGLAGM